MLRHRDISFSNDDFPFAEPFPYQRRRTDRRPIPAIQLIPSAQRPGVRRNTVSNALIAFLSAAVVSLPATVVANSVEYELAAVPASAAVQVSGRDGVLEGFVLSADDTATFRVHGPGRLRIFASVLLRQNATPPVDPRVLVVLDGAGKHFPLKTVRQNEFRVHAQAYRSSRPTEPAVIALKLDERERELSFRLPPGSSHRVLIAFEAKRRVRLAAEVAPEVAAASEPSSEADDEPSSGEDALEDEADFDPFADLDLVPIAPLDGAASPDSGAPDSAPPFANASEPAPRADELTAHRDSSARTAESSGSWATSSLPPEDDGRSVPLGFVVVPLDGVSPGAPGMSRGRSQSAERGTSFFTGVELIPRAGYNLGRDRLAGLGLYQIELSTRLDAWKMPALRLALSSGYASFAGAWRGTEPGRGFGRFHQQSTVIPVELGLVVEPFRGAAVSPYLGASFTTGFVHTSLQRYSLPEETSGGLLLAGTASAGLRLRFQRIVALVELRHTEGQTGLEGTLASAQGILSSTALLGGIGLAFR